MMKASKSEPTPLMRRVAHLLCIPVEDIDGKRLNQAAMSVQRRDREYWDAMANANQMHGNAPRSVCIAVVYDWLND